MTIESGFVITLSSRLPNRLARLNLTGYPPVSCTGQHGGGPSLTLEQPLTTAAFSMDAGLLTGDGDLSIEEYGHWDGGTMSGRGRTVLGSAAQMAVSGGFNPMILCRCPPFPVLCYPPPWPEPKLDGRTFINAGTLNSRWFYEGSLSLENGAVLVNESSGRLMVTLGIGSSSRGTIRNAGTYVSSCGTTAPSLTNSGTLIIDCPTLTTTIDDYTQTGGVTVIGSPGSPANVISNRMTIAGGRLEGSGTITGTVTNAGTLAVGSSDARGTLRIVGDYTQTGGEMDFGIGSTPDRLDVSGVFSVRGSVLRVSRLKEFSARPGDTFDLVTRPLRLSAVELRHANFSYNRSISFANAKSRSLTPPASCVVRRMSTRL